MPTTPITTTTPVTGPYTSSASGTMRANVFVAPNRIEIRDVPRPHAGPGEAVIRVTLTTICGTDLHIVRGEYPVKSGLVIGHEAVGVIDRDCAHGSPDDGRPAPALSRPKCPGPANVPRVAAA